VSSSPHSKREKKKKTRKRRCGEEEKKWKGKIHLSSQPTPKKNINKKKMYSIEQTNEVLSKILFSD
jgi:hypothetical protein